MKITYLPTRLPANSGRRVSRTTSKNWRIMVMPAKSKAIQNRATRGLPAVPASVMYGDEWVREPVYGRRIQPGPAGARTSAREAGFSTPSLGVRNAPMTIEGLSEYGRLTEYSEVLFSACQIWFSPPPQLNDPFECRPWFTFEGTGEQIAEKLVRRFRLQNPLMTQDTEIEKAGQVP